jgi:hypothetical protein
MMRNKGFVNVLVIILLLVASAGVALMTYFFGSGKLQWNNENQTPNPTSSTASTPTPTPAPTLKPGWKVYKNEQYGFEISYPSSYQALDDEKNLYGWPKAVVLFYSGGQSYDLAVEVWNTEAEYKAKYGSPIYDLTVKEVNGKFITLLNANKTTEVSEIVSTFKTTP